MPRGFDPGLPEEAPDDQLPQELRVADGGDRFCRIAAKDDRTDDESDSV